MPPAPSRIDEFLFYQTVVGTIPAPWLREGGGPGADAFGMPGVSGLNVYSLLVAVIGAAVFLIVYHALTRRRV